MKTSSNFRYPNYLITILVLLLSISSSVRAWVYPEHRDIAIQAVQILPPDYRTEFNRLWGVSRKGYEAFLCESAADASQGLTTDCIDWAAFSAIAGDHSCSSKEMLNSITREDWLIDVANVSAQLKANLSSIPVESLNSDDGLFTDNYDEFLEKINKHENRAKRANAVRKADNQLLSADPKYATRAGSNTAHFLIARPSSNTTNQQYAKLALSPGSEINTIGVYAWYHIRALQKASRLANEPQLTNKQRQMLTRAMLADEGFALHFLEDAFAAGHVAGTWGKVSERLGTHNYYNQHGLETFTWNRGDYPVVLMGDSHMRKQDMELAAKTISTSLKQVIDFSTGKDTGYEQLYTPSAPMLPDDLNVCEHNQLPQLFADKTQAEKYIPPLVESIINTPIPALGTDLGSLPRFRSEIGPFIGLAGSLDVRLTDGGFFESQNESGTITGLDLSFRAGFGMDGVMDEAGDGLVFASLGFRSDSASSIHFTDSSLTANSGSLGAAIPARSSITARIRMPFYLIPTDLLWLSPIYLFNKEAYTDIAVTAGNGGLIPWQQGIATSVGRFQFVLGREIGATFFGRNDSDRLFVPTDSETNPLQLTSIESILFDLPIVEYRPYRSFSSNQSSSVMFQLFVAADVPQNNDPVIQGVTYKMDTVWSIGIRMVFDWRHY